MKPVIEMRTYKTLPGKRAEFLEIFTGQSIPAHAHIGMKIVGPFNSLEDPDVFFFMRAFPDASARDAMKRSFYEGTLWKTELEQVLMPMLVKYEAVLVEDSQGLFQPWSVM
jgi:NIPSNAP